MIQSTSDPCKLCAGKEGLFGVVGLQTNDTLFVGNNQFVVLEDGGIAGAKMLAEPVEKLSPDNQVIFSGGIVQQSDKTVFFKPKKQG